MGPRAFRLVGGWLPVVGAFLGAPCAGWVGPPLFRLVGGWSPVVSALVAGRVWKDLAWWAAVGAREHLVSVPCGGRRLECRTLTASHKLHHTVGNAPHRVHHIGAHRIFLTKVLESLPLEAKTTPLCVSVVQDHVPQDPRPS